MQRVTPDIGEEFSPVVDTIRYSLLTDLFQGVGEGISGRGVTRLPVKQVGLNLPDPTKTALENWTSSCVIPGHLAAALRVQEEFRTADHAAIFHKGWGDYRKRNVARLEAELEKNLMGAPASVARHLRQVAKTGACLKVQPSIVNETGMGAQEWRDALFLQYVIDIPYLPRHCDGFNATLSICHVLY